MKKTAIALFLVGLGGLLHAQEGIRWVDLRTAYVTQGGKWRGIEIKDNLGLGLGLGGWLTDRWGVEGSFLTTYLVSKNLYPEHKGSEIIGFASGLFNLNPGDHRFYPFLIAGVGASRIADPWSEKNEFTTRLQYHGGVGVQGLFTDHLLARAEALAVHIETTSGRTEYLGLLGVGYHWGDSKPVAVAPPPPPPPVVEEVKTVAPPPPPPPPPAPVEEAKPVVVVPPPPAKIVLDQAVLHFANGRNELSVEGVEAVQKVARELKAYPGEYALTVSGHTSSIGGKAYNKALSERRANAVAKVLIDSGLPAAVIETVGMGLDQPIADNKTADGQARNRRVEIDVKVKDGSVEKHTIQTGIQDTPQPAP